MNTTNTLLALIVIGGAFFYLSRPKKKRPQDTGGNFEFLSSETRSMLGQTNLELSDPELAQEIKDDLAYAEDQAKWDLRLAHY